jgi:hypothetical protein
MSNVLIGIIGVVLFIGLALAGAMFLGPRFQEATTNSKASAMMTAISQASHAANLYRLETGNDVPGNAVGDAAASAALVTPGYLKSVPVTNEYGVGFRAMDGAVAPTKPTLTVNGIADSVEGRRLCAAIAKQSGLVLDADGNAPSTDVPTGTQGCFRIKNSWGGLPVGFMIAYQRI